ncbi:anhydro-N-acetylmuramic acid kinase [Fervidobacterium riparium]|uniref:Anhydro-N-acetylmuramic acid kinase n=1 Tax=Fervidobacterium gondwanense DSM 13020 TaxID=1121883 RepID=A0A1M7T2Q9_FERGO|nr:anhydro-N-acetylmuramic acid kinase [Fervidobacterium gondwanense]SHN65050.1 anhydro-N-acetylmuramic acid kinase [Fervidobacterium gondwanense DSM 13020]
MNKLIKIWDWNEFLSSINKPVHKVLGLMSGTSADGLDIANVVFTYNYEAINFRVESALTIPYEEELQKKIVDSYNKSLSNVENITLLNFELAQIHAQMINQLGWDYDFVAYHGQTIYHLPEHGATLQIGEADVLATQLGKPVIYDFRKKDVALGGQGAPISAYLDSVFLLTDQQTAVLNIGGISNVTAYDNNNNLVAFDTGPGNCLIDLVCQKHFNIRYDNNGKLSAQGRINNELLEYLIEKNTDYIHKKPPKTTGREVYNEGFLKTPVSTSKEDLLRTVTRFTAEMIAINLKQHLPNTQKLVVVGGGAYNKTLLWDIKTLGYEITVPDKWLIDFREATAIAFLGELFLRGLAHEKVVTGAMKTSILGKLALPL